VPIRPATIVYYEKLKARDKCLSLTPDEFMESEEYKDVNIWDLDYQSTSDEEDNDSQEEEDDDES